jgi:hypothetical protein
MGERVSKRAERHLALPTVHPQLILDRPVSRPISASKPLLPAAIALAAWCVTVKPDHINIGIRMRAGNSIAVYGRPYPITNRTSGDPELAAAYAPDIGELPHQAPVAAQDCFNFAAVTAA